MLVLSGLGTPCLWQQEPGWAVLMVRRDMSVTAERPGRSHLSPPGPTARPNPNSAAHRELPFAEGQQHTLAQPWGIYCGGESIASPVTQRASN